MSRDYLETHHDPRPPEQRRREAIAARNKCVPTLARALGKTFKRLKESGQ